MPVPWTRSFLDVVFSEYEQLIPFFANFDTYNFLPCWAPAGDTSSAERNAAERQTIGGKAEATGSAAYDWSFLGCGGSFRNRLRFAFDRSRSSEFRSDADHKTNDGDLKEISLS
jgi:hypothetical protein